MGRSNIEWCDNTWNPITGCKYYDQCIYCPGRNKISNFSGDIRWNMSLIDQYEMDDEVYVLQKNMEREGGKPILYPFGYRPTIHKHKLDKIPFTAACKMYVGSIGEMFGPWIEDRWIQQVFETCKKYEQHVYMFLTSYPERFEELFKKGLLPDGSNMWYGVYTENNKTVIPRLPDNYNIFAFADLNQSHITITAQVKWVILDNFSSSEGKHQEILKNGKTAGVPIFAIGKDGRKCWPESMKDYLKKYEYTEKQKKRHFCNCSICRNQYAKKGMYSVESRVLGKKTRTMRTIGYICPECAEKLQKLYDLDFDKVKSKGEEE